ncbi:MAG: ABC transporter permease, partial [Clostridium sp.]
MKGYKGLVTKYIKNEKRSVVPIFLSIVLTISLITSVVFITQNIVKNNFEEKKLLFGDYDIRLQNLDNDRLSKVKANDNVEDYILGKNNEELINKFQGLTNEDSWLTYVDAYGVEKKFLDKYITLNVVEGRLPEKQNEIVMNKSVLSRFSGKYEVGSTIQFSQRERKITAEYMYRAGQIYNELDNSKVKDIESVDREIQELVDKDIKVDNDKTVNYTIVGIVETPVGDRLFGDKVIRLLTDEEISNNSNTFETFTYLKDTSKEEQFAKELGLRYIVPNISMTDPFGYPGAEVKYPGYNKDSYSSIRANALARMIILIIIIFCFMAVYNTFHSSIAKRIKVYGILRALGGTMNQISYLIYYEALALYIIAAPIGLIIGYGLTKLESYILINWLGLLEKFTMDFNLEVILITLVSVLLIILIAFRSVLKKEGKLTPIEAIMDARGLTRKKKSLGQNIFGKASAVANNKEDDEKRIKELLDYDKTTFKFKIMQKLFKFEGEIAHKNITRDSKTHNLTKSTLFFAMAILICFFLQVVVGGIEAKNIIKSDKWDTELTLNSGDFDNGVIDKINNVNGVEKIYTATQEKAFLVEPNKFLSSELQAVLIEKPYKKIDKEHDTQGLTASIITLDDNSLKLYDGVKKEELDNGGV